MAKTRLSHIQQACEASKKWSNRESLSQVLDQAMELADAGSHFRAIDILNSHESEFRELEESPLKVRYHQVQELIQATVRPKEAETQKEVFQEKPDPIPQREPEPPQVVDASRPQADSAPHSIPSFRDPPETTNRTTEQTSPVPPPCKRFTYDLGEKGRLHVIGPDKPLTFGRYKSQHGPDYELLAAIPKEKSETSRLIRMLSARHGSIIHSAGQWGILDSWPNQDVSSTNGIFIEKVKLESPASFRRLHGKHLSFATADETIPLPHFRIYVLDAKTFDAPESVLLERLDAFKDHILLLAGEAELPNTFAPLSFNRTAKGFTIGNEPSPVTPQTQGVISFESLEVSPFEPVFFGREI
ncbi:hypothetical protein IEN85_09845 [Pelagicoccus sp. NFK12]|uniref:FHA domain-containing protein n=1 Tax=Pelagicoccus enzymogenes TaxID=2773457 RepID=A0A927F8G6_9BACT|nr:hypothetical protein [Pelagicoccus enzymogenes]MBD5779794.1 hypothetical protein [Pelagicoccus enzymogenes]